MLSGKNLMWEYIRERLYIVRIRVFEAKSGHSRGTVNYGEVKTIFSIK